jgi:dipeptidase D
MTSSTDRILSYFNDINRIPRCSTHEAELARWLCSWAESRDFVVRSDAAGNMVIQVPASHGHSAAPTLVIQGHLDMVCEKTPQSSHDFSSDPIVSRIDGDWLEADGTTLGADNGIAIAYALALSEDDTVAHPPLELLFTVDEESGLNGAKQLDTSLVSGKMLLNLDSEDEGVFTVGCAGGQDYELEIEAAASPLTDAHCGYSLTIGGLKGGHSGIDIHQPRGNANKILARILEELSADYPIQLVELSGGSRHNAIPRDASALVAVKEDVLEQFGERLEVLGKKTRKAFIENEPDLVISHASHKIRGRGAMSPADTQKVVQALLALPHGVAAMSSSFGHVVETSANLATVRFTDNRVTFLSSQRSSEVYCLETINKQVLAVAALAGATVRPTTGYPPWSPDPHSALLERCHRVYRETFGQDPVVQVIHAGLECAIIGDLYDGMDMISLGPTIQSPHSPSERLYLPSVEKVWRFLVNLLADFT